MPDLIYRNNEWVQNSWLVTNFIELIDNALKKYHFESYDKSFLEKVRNYTSWQRKYSAVQKQYVDKIINKVVR